MATNLRKYTTQEVLNKVYEDASGNTIGINAATAKETLNAALDESNSRLNVSLAGGTISGDVTIAGDLTVTGVGGGFAYTEVITGDVQINGPIGTGAATAGVLVLSTAEPTVRVATVDQLGRIDFQAPSEALEGDAILVGASIFAEAEEDFSSTNNSTGLVFSTATTSAPIERMRIDQDGNVGIGTASPDYTLDVEKAVTGDWLARVLNTATSSNPSGLLVRVDDADSTGILLGAHSGTYKFVVKPDGKVGIGTSSPTTTLDVTANVDDNWAGRFENTHSGGYGGLFKIAGTTANDIALQIRSGGSTNHLTVLGTGNIGIGTTAPTNILNLVKVSSSPAISIDTYSASTGDNSQLNLRKSKGTTVGTQVDTVDGDELGRITFQGVNTGDSFDNGARIFAKQSGAAGNDEIPADLYLDTYGDTALNTNQLVLHHDGSVGIGTNAPDDKLHVVGSLFLEADSPEITFETTGGSHSNWQIAAQENVSQALEFSVGSVDGDASNDTFTPKMVILSSGKVEIADTAEDVISLEVGGAVEASAGLSTFGAAVTIINKRNSADQHGLIVGSKNASSFPLKVGRHDSAFTDFVVDGAGNVGIGAVGTEKLRVEGTNSTTRLQASNDGGYVELMMYPDQAADNADLRKIKVADGGTMSFESYRGGSFASDLNIDGATGNVGIGTGANVDTRLHLESATSLEPVLRLENTNADQHNAQLHFIKNTSDEADGDHLGQIDWKGNNNVASLELFGRIQVDSVTVGDGAETGKMMFLVRATSDSIANRMVLDGNSRISLTNNDAGGSGGSDGLSANTIFGYLAGDDIADGGVDNTYFGHKAGSNNATGDDNVFIGSNAGKGAHGNSNSNNVGIGSDTMLTITTGSHNVAIGAASLDALTTGGSNVAIGYAALSAAGAGESSNIAIGESSMTSADEGSGSGNAINTNIAIGVNSLTGGDFGSTGSRTLVDNIAIGTNALNSTGVNSQTGTIAIGSSALTALTSGAGNVAIGFQAGMAATDNSRNTVMGHGAYRYSTSSDDNVVIGYNALRNAGSANAGSDKNIAIGSYALDAADGGENDNIAIGYDAMGNANNSSTEFNIAIGNYTLDAIAGNTQTGTIAIGHNALTALTSGASNTAVGYTALDELTTGDNNTAIGYGALNQLDGTEDDNTAVGYNAGEGTDGGSQNTIIGSQSNISTGAGTNQTLLGYHVSGVANNSVVLGNDLVTAVYMSDDSGAKVHCGRMDMITDYAGNYPLHVQNQGANANRYGIRIQAGADDASGTTIYINALDGDGDQVGHISNTSGTFALTDPSDKRLKKNIVDTSVKGLETVGKMKIRDFEWKKSGDKMIGGFIAQELKEAYPSAVTGTDGEMENILDEDGKKTGEKIVPMGVSRDVIVPVLVKAIQELEARVKELEGE